MQTRIYHEADQGTEEWLKDRQGKITGSRIHDVMAQGKGLSRAKYLRELAGEIITGNSEGNYTNAHMDRGTELEPLARELYSLQQSAECKQVGFVSNSDLPGLGCSPDTEIVGTNGIIEIKCRLAHIQIKLLEDDKIDSQCIKQMNFNMYVGGYDFCDYVSFCEGLPLYVKRFYPDEVLLDQMKEDIKQAQFDLNSLVERIKGKL